MRQRLAGVLLCGLLLGCVGPTWAASQGPTPEQLQELSRGALADRAQVDAAFARAVTAYDAGDYAAAYEWWIPMARTGDPAAQRNIAHLYRMGQGVERDLATAAKWYRRAAESGLARAQMNLGGMYLRGQGVEQDYREAAHWFTAAAVQGHVLAQYNLGLMYMRGLGVERNEAKATGWFYLASKAGHEPSLEALASLVRVVSGPPGPPRPAASAGDSAAAAADAADEIADDDTGPEAGREDAAKPDDDDSDGDDGNRSADPAAAGVVAHLADALQAVFRRNPKTGYVVPDVLPPETGRHGGDDGLANGLSGFELARNELLPPAEGGDVIAQYQLAKLYLNESAHEASYALGYYWMARAAANGHATAKAEQTRLKRILDETDLDQGERLLAEWRARDG